MTTFGVLFGQVYSYPVLFVIGAFSFFILLRKLGKNRYRPGHEKSIRRAWQLNPLANPRADQWVQLLVAAGGLLIFGVVTGRYLFSTFFSDHIEATVPSLGMLFLNGKDLYPDPNSAPAYSMLYGPLTYLASAASFWLFGASMASAKVMGVSSSFLGLFLFYRGIRTFAERRFAFFLTGLGALNLIYFFPGSIWSRPDPFILLSVCLGIFGATRKNPRIAAVLVGLGAGLALNLKPHHVLWFLPLVMTIDSKKRKSVISLAGVVFVSAGVFPYLHPQISATHYLELLRLISRHGIDRSVLLVNLLVVLWIQLPLDLLALSAVRNLNRRPERSLVYVISIASLALLVIGASKSGSGPIHLQPTFFLFCYLLIWSFPEIGKTFSLFFDQTITLGWLSYLLISVAIIPPSITRLFRGIDTMHGADVLNDMRSYLESHSKETIQVGDGGDYRHSFFRFFLVAAGHPYWFDQAALMDYQKAGITFSPKFTKELRLCTTTTWLIPRGTRPPFSEQNWYAGVGDLYPESFQKEFLLNYRLRGQTKFFDIYSCKATGKVSSFLRETF